MTLILRMIMSTGTALCILTTSGILLCPLQDPINIDMCVKSTVTIWRALTNAGIAPFAVASIGGFIVNYMCIRDRTN